MDEAVEQAYIEACKEAAHRAVVEKSESRASYFWGIEIGLGKALVLLGYTPKQVLAIREEAVTE